MDSSIDPVLSPELSKSPSRFQQLLIPSLAIFSLLLLLTSAHLYFQIQSIKSQLTSACSSSPESSLTSLPPSPPPSPSVAIFTSNYKFGTSIVYEFEKLLNQHSGELLSAESTQVWWISPDDLNIINQDEIGLEHRLTCKSPLSQKTPYFDAIENLSSSIALIMKSQGFVINQKNSSQSLVDDQFYDYIQAFETSDLKCIFKVNPDCGRDHKSPTNYHTISFTCTDNFDWNYQEQSPYLKDLNIKNHTIYVSKKVDDFVLLSVSGRRAGHLLLAKRINGKWVEVSSGQEGPSCEAVDRFNVPKELYGECY
jgi:hypothetical protein